MKKQIKRIGAIALGTAFAFVATLAIAFVFLNLDLFIKFLFEGSVKSVVAIGLAGFLSGGLAIWLWLMGRK